MNRIVIIAAAVLSLALSGCTTVAPLCATGNPIGTKTGEAQTTFLFGCIPIKNHGDYSTVTAAKNGGITKISTVDVKRKRYFFIVVKKTCIVTGE